MASSAAVSTLRRPSHFRHIGLPETNFTRVPRRSYQAAAPSTSAKPLPHDAMSKANPLRQAFTRLRSADSSARGQASLGMWQMLPGAYISRTLARTPGIDWVLVDCEHGAIDDAEMHAAVPVIAAEGASPIVRIPDFQSWMVKRALDSGAHGTQILAPLIRTVDEVKEFVAACKFPPQGRRGFGSPLAMQGFRVTQEDDPSPHPVALPTFTEYLDQANASIVTMVQIETRDAVENVEAIAPLVDALFVGPFDLANNIGHPIRDGVFPTEVKDAMARVLAAAQSVEGCCCGVYAGSPAQARDYAAAGFHMVNVVTDVLTLQAAASAAVHVARGQGG
ncbi:2,4-dihydroxyhept-2-ene-1,7-dioic acid aldolase [Sporothrix brasiliensis 5110]|uniref:2,4-dihydroxyhept-2-ene-1,7-dioic acid aldolase n=1 Tax=Sporothrix brasiliensis 5110 TaxID=1398154 RepID=A0A0C2J140_9PEZI|nr:2,4-dihydroxyhept-2-ene-1,7-dioic acid aldolase [Sporothrix brasiliensis 5110]KIH95071.1 2,4-dihydroxyhept-2-ene-1,7-dioic acid aldolase [Sporothrix brasiliensis 5110]